MTHIIGRQQGLIECSFWQVALICSLVDGKVFMDWVGPAMLKAYQWQVSSVETSYMEISDIYDTDDLARGLPGSLIERLPVLVFEDLNHHEGGSTCSICLQVSLPRHLIHLRLCNILWGLIVMRALLLFS